MGAAQVSGRVRLAENAQEVGLAAMIVDLIRANLEQNPGKWADLVRLDGPVSLDAVDAGVSVTLAFQGGTLIVHEGIRGSPYIRISASAEALLGLAAVKIRAGLPFLFGRDGRGLRRRLFTGQVRIAGAFRRPIQLIRFTRLMSVNG